MSRNGMWLKYAPKRHWTLCSRYANQSRLNSWYDWGGDLYDHFTEHENLHFENIKDVHMSSEKDKAYGYEHDLDMLIISH